MVETEQIGNEFTNRTDRLEANTQLEQTDWRRVHSRNRQIEGEFTVRTEQIRGRIWDRTDRKRVHDRN